MPERSAPPAHEASRPKAHEELALSPQVELIKARLREFFREPGILFWVFGFPILMAIGLGIAFRERPPARPVVAVVSQDESSSLLGQALLQSERVDARSYELGAAERALSRARVDVVAEISEQGVTYRLDPMQEKSALAKLVTDEVIQEAAGRRSPVSSRELVSEEQGTRYIDFLIPGLIGLNLMGSSMWSIGFNLVVARKRKLLRRYAVTPMRRAQFLLSYFYSRVLFLAFELSLLVAFGVLVFGTIVQGSWLALAVVATLGAASFAGIGLLIGSRLENSETASGWMNVVQLPMWVLSGAFFSYERFPEIVHKPIEALPLTALVNALRAVYNDGAGLTALGPEMLVLSIWGLLGFFVALRVFRWQ